MLHSFRFLYGNYCSWPKQLFQISAHNMMLSISTENIILLKVHSSQWKKEIWKFPIISSVLSFFATSATI